MQSKAHEALFKKMLDITTEIRSSLDEADAETLMDLARRQRTVLEELRSIGLSGDTALLDLARELQGQVQEALREVGDRYRTIGEQLAEVRKNKRQPAPYGRGLGDICRDAWSDSVGARM